MEHKYSEKYEANGNKVIECIDCGFKHLYPLPTRRQLNDFYKNHFEESTPSPNLQDKKETLLGFVGNSPDKRILDVGAWNGEFLDKFEHLGWERVGIEPNQKKRKVLELKGIKVFGAFLEKVDVATLGKFDVVNFSFVLEHTLMPRKNLEIAFNDLLKPEGVVCIEVPNEFNPLQTAIVQNMDIPIYWIYSPDHINYFNFESLDKLIQSVGFDVLHKESDFPLELFVLMGENYIGNEEVGKRIHKKRCVLEDNLEKAGLNNLKRSIYKHFASLNIGRSILMYARKPLIDI